MVACHHLSRDYLGPLNLTVSKRTTHLISEHTSDIQVAHGAPPSRILSVLPRSHELNFLAAEQLKRNEGEGEKCALREIRLHCTRVDRPQPTLEMDSFCSAKSAIFET